MTHTRGVMLADIIICTSVLVDPTETLESSEWLVFLVLGPADTPVFQQINDAGHVVRNLAEGVIANILSVYL